jgi:hypothetical protein
LCAPSFGYPAVGFTKLATRVLASCNATNRRSEVVRVAS